MKGIKNYCMELYTSKTVILELISNKNHISKSNIFSRSQRFLKSKGFSKGN